MSVSAFNTSVPASSTSEPSLSHPKAEAKASRHAPATLSFNSQNTVNVSFNSGANQAGPALGDYHRPTQHHGSHHHPALPHGFLQQLQQLISQWFGGKKPPVHDHCPKPPGSGAGQPGPDYSKRSNEQLGEALLKNFKAFTGSSHSNTMHTSAIAAMARREPGSDPVMNENIKLAKELMRRPDVLAAFDRNAGTGAVDGRINKQQLRAFLRDDNAFNYKSDKAVAQEMLSHFDQLKSRFGRQEINIRDLRKLASQPLTGNESKDHLVQLAKAVLNRSDLLTKMDNLAGRDSDGRISKHALEILSR